MPFNSIKSLPPYVKNYTPKVMRQWMHVFNTVFKNTGDEVRAFRAGNSVLKKRLKSKTALNMDHRDNFSMLVDEYIGNLRG